MRTASRAWAVPAVRALRWKWGMGGEGMHTPGRGVGTASTLSLKMMGPMLDSFSSVL